MGNSLIENCPSTDKTPDKDELCGMLEVLLDENASKEDRQNDLIKAISMLRDGKSRDEIIKSGIDEHTIDLAQAVK